MKQDFAEISQNHPKYVIFPHLSLCERIVRNVQVVKFLSVLNFQASFETPYVVRLHNVNVLDVPQPVFTFEHPNRSKLRFIRYTEYDFLYINGIMQAQTFLLQTL